MEDSIGRVRDKSEISASAPGRGRAWARKEECGLSRKPKGPPDLRRTRKYLDLKAALEESLQVRGLSGQVYTDKVQEYLDFWVRRQELQADVAQRGLTVTDDRGRMSENRSVTLEIQVSRQMLAIFAALGFKDEAAKGSPGAEDSDVL